MINQLHMISKLSSYSSIQFEVKCTVNQKKYINNYRSAPNIRRDAYRSISEGMATAGRPLSLAYSQRCSSTVSLSHGHIDVKLLQHMLTLQCLHDKSQDNKNKYWYTCTVWLKQCQWHHCKIQDQQNKHICWKQWHIKIQTYGLVSSLLCNML